MGELVLSGNAIPNTIIEFLAFFQKAASHSIA
jgi:hypothetical protein